MDFRELRKRAQRDKSGKARRIEAQIEPDDIDDVDDTSDVASEVVPTVHVKPKPSKKPRPSPVEPETAAAVAPTPQPDAIENEEAAAPADEPAGYAGDIFAGEDELEDLHRVEILRFRLKAEFFALYLEETEEIIKPRGFTPVPRTPPWILGIVSLRGTMVPVIDLAGRLGIDAEAPATQRIIIINHEGELCGLLVDEVKNVELIDPGSVESIPAALHESAGRFLNGLVRVGGELIALLDVEAILNLEGHRVESAA